MSNHIIDDTDPDSIPIEQQAYESGPLCWKDRVLAPFAVSREAAWNIHRHILGAPPLSEIIENTHAMAADAFRILWFCAHDPAEWIEAPTGERTADLHWRRFTSQERAARLEQRINEWACVHIDGAEIPAAVDLVFEILERARQTRAVVPGDGKARTLGN